jgi:Co/Zn/Cd efflux system component
MVGTINNLHARITLKVVSFIKNLSLDQRRVALVIGLNITIVIIESTVGVISGSLALLSDAWHNLSDVLALIVTAIALGLGGSRRRLRNDLWLCPK